MSRAGPHILLLIASFSFIIVWFAVPALAQSQAVNGQIEGTILDPTGAVIAGADITVINLETGASRKWLTNGNGVYRIPLLPLGTYRVIAEAPGFRRMVQNGITLTTGEAATVDLRLESGELGETVTVSADASIADTGKADLGRVMDAREVHNVPLPTRNPYNFIILQANVTGRPNRGFNFPQVNVNGFARRVNYLLDGNVNTRGDRAGTRLMVVSEGYVNEIQLLTNGFAAEFGNTTGMIVNMVTPSGTNDLHGSALYFFRRPSFYARPFFFSAPELPDNVTNNFAGMVGGPIIKDRWHFYFGYEYVRRDDSTRANRQVTISETNKTALIAAGLPSSTFVPAIPSQERGPHYIFRTDAQLNENNRLTVRFNHSDLVVGNNIQGGANTMQRSVDLVTTDHAVGVQLASFTRRFLNELRFQYVRSWGSTDRNENSGNGPAILIPNVANFGSPTNAGSTGLTRVFQLQDNVTWTRRSHVAKFGAGFVSIHDIDRSAVFSQYTFPSIAAYTAAQRGMEPYGYTRYDESFGNPEIRYTSTYWNIFLQDDWKATPRLKLNFGLRYDLYLIPKADPNSPIPASRKFEVDRNNFAPRFGLVYTLRDGTLPLVLRAGGGMYYEPPWLDMYTRALLDDGDPKFFSLRFRGTDGGVRLRDPLAPAFPNTFSGSQPLGSTLPPQDIVSVSPDLENMYTINSNVQLEKALTEDLSLAVGYVHAAGRHIPVYRSTNVVNAVRFLADGRPVFGPERLDPRFNVIQTAESAGVSRYDALTVQLTQRFSHGIQFSANYTLSKAIDDAPEQNVAYMGGTGTVLALSDPTDRSRDKGYSFGDQRHTFVMSLVSRPRINLTNKLLNYVFNRNQFAIITTANSGERFSVTTNTDLNADGLCFLSAVSYCDRPVGINRNSGKTPPQFNTDLRYSRFLNFSDRFKLEFIGEVQNLFNVNSIIAYNDVSVPVNPITGELLGALPDFRLRNSSVSIESRQFQVGVRLHF